VPLDQFENRDANDDFVQFGQDSVRAAISGARRPRRKPEDPSEDDVALAFTKAHGNTLRFDHDIGQWFEWAGMRWQKDGCHRAFTYARTMAREIGGAGKASFAGGVEKFARADPVHAVTSEIWDSDPLLLGTPRGTVDLRDGSFAPARPEDHNTKLTGVAPAHGEPVRWLQFLHEATAGDHGLMRFLQQMAGYCLTGLTDEHALFFIYGPGGNGKSVFLNILNHVFGDYATTASMDTFTASKSDRHPTDLAMLKGARLVSASETEEGRAWAEARIKQLTGGDRISARFMRQDFFEFSPAFKLVIVGNHAPVLTNVDDAMRRRFNIVPFTHKPTQPDPLLEQKLKEEAPQILAWAIEGCIDWQRNRLVRPEIVSMTTQDYFDDQDLFGQWIADRCERGANKWEQPTPLYNDWVEYARVAGDDPGTLKALGSKLKRNGFQSGKVRGVRCWKGVALKRKGSFGG
jgi:P4 family phage/plasmid primase-like protien